MKVVLISSSDSSGGAAIACYRLHNALRHNGVDSSMLVRHKLKKEPFIQSVNQLNYFKEKEVHPRFALEKLLFIPYEKSKKDRFAFSTGTFGFSLYKNKLIQEADVLHLHWITGSFISLSGLKKLLSLNKPVVWTMHDMWPFTGGCHYVGDCKNYQSACMNCPLLKNPSKKDCSVKIFKRKEKILNSKNITAVGCSKWMATIARSSALFSQFNVTNIPNPIDQSAFFQEDKTKCKTELGLDKNKIHLLFAAGNIFDERKGIKYLVESLKQLSGKPEITNRLELMVMGKSTGNLDSYFPVPVNYLGQVTGSDNLRRIYCAADAFLLPSLQDNLPNTIMESLACGTPVIAFRTGGVPEMIEHKNTGFLAEEKSSESLAEGINWLIDNNNEDIKGLCIEFVNNNYSEKVIAAQYLHLYESLIKNGK